MYRDTAYVHEFYSSVQCTEVYIMNILIQYPGTVHGTYIHVVHPLYTHVKSTTVAEDSNSFVTSIFVLFIY